MQSHSPDVTWKDSLLDAEKPPGWGHAILCSPWLWGGLITIGFYLGVPHLTVFREEIERYCTMHWVEYLEVGLFAVGLVVLVQKVYAIRGEYAAFASLGRVPLTTDPAESHQLLIHDLAQLPPTLSLTVWARRIRSIGRFLKERTTAVNLKDQLAFLSNNAADSLHDSHSVLQTIIWAIPIMGFLGTVLGITLAIANVTPEKLDTSLPEVTGGLAVAFDTTAIALLFSLALVFGSLFVKRHEDSILTQAEESALALCGRLIDGPAEPESALITAERESARLLIESTGQLIEQQAGHWESSLDRLRNRWSETISAHEQLLNESLVVGTQSSLASHTEQLEKMRAEFLASYHLVSQHITTTIENIESDRKVHDSARQQQLEHWTTMLREDIAAATRQQQWQLRNTIDEFASRLERWQSSLQQLTASSESHATTLARHSGQLMQIVGHEENLTALQARLTENLAAIRNTEQFEESILSLNAAIHLLSARIHSRAA